MKNNIKLRPTYRRQTSIGHEIDSEHSLQKICVKKLRAHNFLCFCTDVFNGLSFLRDVRSKSIYKQHMIAMGATVGQPDLIILYRGEVTFVEFKYGKGKKSPEQVAQTLLLESQGYPVLEWRTEKDCNDWMLSKMNLKARDK